MSAVSFNDATVVYSLDVVAGGTSMFTIDSYQGSLTLLQKVDYDIAVDDASSREFTLKVTASESKIGGMVSSTLVRN